MNHQSSIIYRHSYGSRDTKYGILDKLYFCRECSTNQTFLCRINPIFPIFHIKTMISLKNKPNSKPIRTRTNPIMNQKLGGAKPNKPNFTLVLCSSASLSGDKLDFPIQQRIALESFYQVLYEISFDKIFVTIRTI